MSLKTCSLPGLLACLCLFPATLEAHSPTRRPAPQKPKPHTPMTLTFQNPLKEDGADPWLFHHDGWYYLSTTTAVDIRVRRARRLGELRDAPDQVVWKDETPSRHRDIWAPEFHLLDAGDGPRWYLYYTASDGKRDENHRMYVAVSAGTDPLGPYTFKAQLLTDPKNEYYAIDGTVLEIGDKARYFIWCGRPSPEGQGLYISRMTNPWTLTGPRAYLNAEGFGCAVVREGPISLRRDGKIYLFYSACSADTPDYKMGMMVADEKSDLADPASWKQHPKIVFARVDQRGVFGPGHNTFFKSPDGKEDWIVYHAKTSIRHTYTDRSTRAQRIHWGSDGMPDLGLPIALETPIPAPSGEPPPDR